MKTGGRKHALDPYPHGAYSPHPCQLARQAGRQVLHSCAGQKEVRMSKKHNNKGRSISDGRFFQMYEWLMRSVAWQYATVYEKALYIEIKRRYNGKNNGDISMSHREAQDLLQCSNRPVSAAFAGLQDKGLIKATVKGAFDWKVARTGNGNGRATRWELTELPRDVPTKVLSGGSKEFMTWRPPAEKTAVRSQHTIGTPTAHHFENKVRLEHTIDDGAYAYGTP